MPKPAISSRHSRTVTLAAKAQIAPAGSDAKATRTFRMVANTGEPMRIWPYEHPVVVDLATLDLSGLPVPALYDHCPDVDFTVGQVQAASVNGSELIAEGAFTITETGDPNRNYARKVLEKADAGYQWQTSIGGDPREVDNIAAGQSVLVNGRTYPGPVCVARGVTLREISFVVLGGDRRTSAVVASGGKNMAASFEDFVQSMGFNPEKLDETQAANMRKLHSEMYPADDADNDPEKDQPTDAGAAGEKVKAGDGEDPPKEDDPAPSNASAKKPALRANRRKPAVNEADIAAQTAAAVRTATVAETKRHAAINRLAASYGNPEIEVKGNDGAVEKVPFALHAIENGWSELQAKAHLLDVVRDRPSGPAIISKSHDKDCTRQTLQGAMILRAGGKLEHKAYKTPGAVALLGKVAPWLLRDINDAERNRYMEAAHHYASMSMIDLCRESIRLNGQDCPRDREDMIRAAFSGGGNLTNIFTTNVNAILLATYVEFGDDTTAGWTSDVDVNDYKTNERPRVNVGSGLKKLPRGGEAEHTSYTDSVESYKIAKYARQFEIDDQDIIDDSFSVFQDTPRQFGQAAARLRPDLVYGAVILANPTLTATSLAVFSDSNATDNNLSTAMSHAAISTLLTKMRLVQENSVNLNLQATHLLVPPALEDLAIELTMSRNILYGADDETIRGADNSLARRGLTIVAEPRLENGVVNPADETTQSGSSTAWYGVCANAHTIEVGYLKGTGRAPKVRTTVLDKGRWGINWDVELSIGVKALDWKGMFKS